MIIELDIYHRFSCGHVKVDLFYKVKPKVSHL